MARKPKKYIYHIILINHGKQLRDLFRADTEKKIYKKFFSLLEENKKVVFPMKYNNEKTVIVESEYELVIIKGKDEKDSDLTKIRDEYGKFIDYSCSDDDWVICDRAHYDIEETFWVYGYHPRIQRKDFNWIFENFISKDSKNKYMFKSVQIFRNKLIIECNGKLEMVICKNKSDSIRLYNKIEEESQKKKYKYVMFMGDVGNGKYKTNWIERIQKLTNWNYTKINRNSTRP